MLTRERGDVDAGEGNAYDSAGASSEQSDERHRQQRARQQEDVESVLRHS